MGKKIQRNSKNKTIITAVILAVVILFGLWLVGRYRVRQDADRFKKAETNLKTVFDGLVAGLGTEPAKIERRNVCYKTAQGAYDTYEDGDLWCQVALGAYYTQEQSDDNLRTTFASVLKNTGITGTQTKANGLVFDAADGISCTLEINDGYLATKPGSFFPDNPNSKTTVILDCSGRSKGKHYEYLKF